MSEHILLDAYHKRICKAANAGHEIADENTVKMVNELKHDAPCADSECTDCMKKKYKHGDAKQISIQGIKTDFTIQWNPEHCPYLYNNHDYTVLPDIPRRFKSMRAKVLLNSLFFSCFCEKWYNGTRRLILQGADLVPRIGRCFQDWDVPYLMVFLRSNKDVVSINLAYNNIHCAGFMNLVDYIIAYKHILELNVQNNNIRAPGIDHLCQDSEKIRLKTLRLNGNKFGVESAKKVALSLLKNPHLRYLDVAEVDQTASSLVYFTTVMRWDQEKCNQTLRVLDLSRPNPGYMYIFDSTHFASVMGCMLRFNRSLVELHLQKYNFSCHDIEIMLEDLKYNNTLHLLDLCNNNIGDHGMEHLANWLKTRPSLNGLLLAHNIMTNHGARALSFGMPFSRIKMLDISYNRITDVGAMDVLNSIKKSTPLRYLRIFGNCLGHSTAKIIERMLVSGVLVQENIDTKPYRVDHKWYLAHYPSDHYKQRYYNVPRYAFPQPLEIPYKINEMSGKSVPKVHFKYVNPVPIEDRRYPVLVTKNSIKKANSYQRLITIRKSVLVWHSEVNIQKNHPFYCVCCDCRDDEVMNSLAPSTTDIIPEDCVCSVCTYEIKLQQPSTFQSDITLVPKRSCPCHPDDCGCCYCIQCKGNNEDLLSLECNKHQIDCNCCECGAQEVEYSSSSISTKSNELHDYPDGIDYLQKIALILERVDNEMQQHILRWININEDTLNSDLEVLEAQRTEMDKTEQKEPSVCDRTPVSVPVPDPICSNYCDDTCCKKQELCVECASLSSIDTDSSVKINCREIFDKILKCSNDSNEIKLIDARQKDLCIGIDVGQD